jgi:hypothetical protein
MELGPILAREQWITTDRIVVAMIGNFSFKDPASTLGQFEWDAKLSQRRRIIRMQVTSHLWINYFSPTQSDAILIWLSYDLNKKEV